jgi:hypothetical protein
MGNSPDCRILRQAVRETPLENCLNNFSAWFHGLYPGLGSLGTDVGVNMAMLIILAMIIRRADGKEVY